MTAEQVAALGPGLASKMSMEQLTEASILFNSITTATTEQNSISLTLVRTTFNNHLRTCIRMPAGGATSGGSQQTGFEMEMVTGPAASRMFAGWPNRESSSGGRKLSWELRSMETLAQLLSLQDTGWGAMQGKPIAIAQGRTAHAGVILVGPPFTVCWTLRPDQTTSLTVRFPLIIWSENDAVILPPDDAQGTPFYVDPSSQPGMHRDMFKTWGRRVAGELALRDFPMSRAVMWHLPMEYQSDCDSEGPAVTPRSESPPISPTYDSRPSDSSDLSGAHKPRSPDSSDLEGAHQPGVARKAWRR